MSYPKVLDIGTIPGCHSSKQEEALGQIRDLDLGIFWQWGLGAFEAALEFGKPSMPILGTLVLKERVTKIPGHALLHQKRFFCLFNIIFLGDVYYSVAKQKQWMSLVKVSLAYYKGRHENY